MQTPTPGRHPRSPEMRPEAGREKTGFGKDVVATVEVAFFILVDL